MIFALPVPAHLHTSVAAATEVTFCKFAEGLSVRVPLFIFEIAAATIERWLSSMCRRCTFRSSEISSGSPENLPRRDAGLDKRRCLGRDLHVSFFWRGESERVQARDERIE